ncbi:hypothetical protein AVEN_236607-1 [Araneus ventricosus]|uniref:Uncharacterized protein n=1 Tax=Araneus ventricosus TaxID=182803 RepID=A0A4Y2Q056_ARAVE|nr:hypothetical protein AVEN_236607-1 [Araneus ventricosus]
MVGSTGLQHSLPICSVYDDRSGGLSIVCPYPLSSETTAKTEFGGSGFRQDDARYTFGLSLSIAREKSWPFRGTRYQGVDCSARCVIERVPWWRSSDFLWPQLHATAPGQKMMNTGTRLFQHDVRLESIQPVRPVRMVVIFADRMISSGIHHVLPMCSYTTTGVDDSVIFVLTPYWVGWSVWA